MDETDHQLLSLLRQDARLSVAALALKLHVSRGTVTNRIRRLEDDGVIVGYTVRLRPDVQHNAIKAWMSIAVDGNQTRSVIASLLGEPGVASLHDTNGRWDLLAELRAETLQELAQVLERIRLVKGISNTETSIHLETYRAS
jgi:DNA-binding Lrp family transcriptional regulator